MTKFIKKINDIVDYKLKITNNLCAIPGWQLNPTNLTKTTHLKLQNIFVKI
jgi:hypothetical protein